MPLQKKSILIFASEASANTASAILSDLPGFDGFPVALKEEGGAWLIECYDDGLLALDGAQAMSALSESGVELAEPPRIETLPEADWVSLSQEGLKPVRAGPFVIHGSHDREKISSQWAIEIDAGRAFGTAHHGTTAGCLIAISRVSAFAFPPVLDLGTGSGVLAIAAAKAFRHRARVTAIDIDPVAVAVARENCRKNGVANEIRFLVGNGWKPSLAPGSFGLVLANILAKPLLKLAPQIRTVTRKGGYAILSGLLSDQAREVVARYRATGFCLVERRDIEGWATLLLRRVA